LLGGEELNAKTLAPDPLPKGAVKSRKHTSLYPRGKDRSDASEVVEAVRRGWIFLGAMILEVEGVRKGGKRKGAVLWCAAISLIESPGMAKRPERCNSTHG